MKTRGDWRVGLLVSAARDIYAAPLVCPWLYAISTTFAASLGSAGRSERLSPSSS